MLPKASSGVECRTCVPRVRSAKVCLGDGSLVPMTVDAGLDMLQTSNEPTLYEAKPVSSVSF